MFSPEEKNSIIHSMEVELTWLENVIAESVNYLSYINKANDDVINVPYNGALCIPAEHKAKTPFSKLLNSQSINQYERFALIASLAPYIAPWIFNKLFSASQSSDKIMNVLGGYIQRDSHTIFLPTAETIIFLLAGNNIDKRHEVMLLLTPGAQLYKRNLVGITSMAEGHPWFKGIVYPTDELLAIVKGHPYRPMQGSNFAAQRVETLLDWNDLVLPYDTTDALTELKIWLRYGKQLALHPEMGRKLKPGYRSLFYGPPGTGKTLTASLLGKENNLDVYRIDLSMVVSKWVGETEKNLKNIFDQAENKDWILFFDEADALFSKRTQANSSNDRYANQEVSYLLQRIEDFQGLVILASNLKGNIDDAFTRRFQSVVYFPMPDTNTRHTLWQKSFPQDYKPESNVDLMNIAQNYEMAGGTIVNVVRYCVLMAMNANRHHVTEEDLEKGIFKELRKEGKLPG